MGRAQPFGQTRVRPRGTTRPRRVLPTRRFLWLPVAAAVAGLVVYTFLFGDTGYLRERAMKRELAALDQEIELLRKQGEELRTVAGGLRAGGIEIERIGRERLGMVRPGEVSYRLVPMDKDGWSLDRRATGR